MGAYYRAELRRRVEAIGYATVQRPWWGRCRGSRSRATRRRCWSSSRPAAATSWPGWRTRGLEYTPANAQQAVLATRRQKKTQPDRAELADLWQRRADGMPARNAIRSAVRRRGAPVPPAPSPLEIDAAGGRASRGAQHVVHGLRSPRVRARVRRRRQTLAAIDAAIVELQRDRLLLEVPADGVDRAFTTRGAAAAEREVLRHAGRAQRRARVGGPDRVAAALAAVRSTPASARRWRRCCWNRTGGRGAGLRRHGEDHDVAGGGAACRRRPSARPRAVDERGPGAQARGRDPDPDPAVVPGPPRRHRRRHGGRRTAGGSRAVHGGGLLVVDEASMIGTTAMVRLLRIAPGGRGPRGPGRRRAQLARSRPASRSGCCSAPACRRRG